MCKHNKVVDLPLILSKNAINPPFLYGVNAKIKTFDPLIVEIGHGKELLR
jgi:hypothetical protein